MAGIAISPILHWAGADVVALQHFAEFGVVTLLFIVGLEMNPKSLWEMRSRISVLGGLQVGITTGAVLAVCLAFGLPMTVGLAIGLVLALSSTAIVNQTLREKGLLRSDGGAGELLGPVDAGYRGDSYAGANSVAGDAGTGRRAGARRWRWFWESPF